MNARNLQPMMPFNAMFQKMLCSNLNVRSIDYFIAEVADCVPYFRFRIATKIVEKVFRCEECLPASFYNFCC